MVSVVSATVLICLLLSLAVSSSAADNDRLIYLLQQTKRSLANGRWGLRPGKRSAEAETFSSTGGDLACDARSISFAQVEVVKLIDKLLLYRSHLRDCEETMATMLTDMEDGSDAGH